VPRLFARCGIEGKVQAFFSPASLDLFVRLITPGTRVLYPCSRFLTSSSIGLIGLAGLAGLAGRRKRDGVRQRERDVTKIRPAA
jgi:MYXO-CTERM domain-containing protein